jgi:hypothetical protein
VTRSQAAAEPDISTEHPMEMVQWDRVADVDQQIESLQPAGMLQPEQRQ